MRAPGKLLRAGRATRLLVAGLWLCLTARVAGAEVEAQVKAALIPKLAGFVEWPPQAFASSNAPVVITLLGEDPFGPEFDSALKEQRIQSRPWRVVRAREWSPTNECHILFVSRSEARHVGKILAGVGMRPVLTLGESSGFAEAGGVVNFTKVDGRVRFEVNLEAAGKHGLKISARLLQVSRVVRTAPASTKD